MENPTPIPVNIAVLIAKGVELANKLHDHLLLEGSPTKDWNHKFLFLGLQAYAASMARFSNLDKADFMHLAEGFYDNIEIQPKADTKIVI